MLVPKVVLYIVNYTGNFLATANGAGITTTKIFQEANSRTITGMAVDPNNDNNLIVSLANYGYTNYVIKLDSTATTATVRSPINITGNLPKWPIYDVVINPENRAQAFLATEQGVYSTANVWAGTVAWDDENASFPRATAMDLQFQRVGVTNQLGTTSLNWYLFAGTHGRGLFYTNTLCGTCDTINTNKGPALGQNDIANLNNELQVYPNPVTNSFDLKLPSAIANNASVVIYNLKGQLMYSQKTNSTLVKINATQWPSGTYIVQANTGSQTKSLKIVKQ
jgi:Secretion system C-terminal sorting domain